jgi:uncharacterized protein (UPF0332 family)
MDLKRYIDNRYLVKCSTSQDEIRELFRIVERDLRLAEKLKDENDWQFAIAYNSVLQLATIPIRASGYRATTKVGHHWVTLTALPEFLGKEFQTEADYFNECRVKRNMVEYKSSGNITIGEALKLIHHAKILKKAVVSWLKKHHPQLDR